MAYTFDENIVSDLHKDARGFRPSSFWMAAWNSYDDATKQEIWDSLLVELEDSMEAEAAAEQKALADFDRLVDNAISLGADGHEGAVRWLLEAEGIDKFDLMYGADYIAFHFGLSYDNPYKAMFEGVIEGMLAK